MKNFLLGAMASLLFVACNQSGKDNQADRNVNLLSDSSSYSNNNIYSDTTSGSGNNQVSNQQNTQPVANPNSNKPQTKIIYIKESPKKQATATQAQSPVVHTPPVVTPAAKDTVSTAAAGTGKSTIPDAGTPGEGETSAPVVKKKGMSKEAQGAIIGGAAGAVGGAIISKKKGVGAVIGGIVGAAGGYIIGKEKAKKEAAAKDTIKTNH